MYADAGYVTENTLAQAEQNGMELLGPTRPDPHKGPYNADAFHVDIEKRQAVCPQGNLSTQCSRIRDNYMGTEYYRIEWGSQCDLCPMQKQWYPFQEWSKNFSRRVASRSGREAASRDA
jgi:hypothetical protein